MQPIIIYPQINIYSNQTNQLKDYLFTLTHVVYFYTFLTPYLDI